MMHDPKCEHTHQGDSCRCEVRALEARLAEAERLALSATDAWEMYKAAFERAERAEALLAEWRNVVRAAIRQESGEEAYDRTDEAVAALSPSAREAAR